MKRLFVYIIACIAILVLFSCSNDSGSVDTQEMNFYSLEDFEEIVIDESTFNDVYDIAPGGSDLFTTSYGCECFYPAKDGKLINIKFYGPENIVFSIEVVDGNDYDFVHDYIND